MTRPLGPTPDTAAMVARGREHIIEGVWGDDTQDLATGLAILHGIDRLVPVDDDPNYLEAQLTAGLEPVFTAWSQDRSATRGNLDEVRSKLVTNVLTPDEGDPGITQLRPKAFGVVSKAVTVLALSQDLSRGSGVDLLWTPYTVASSASKPDYQDSQGRGWRHFEVATPIDEAPVPVRITETTDDAKDQGKFKVADGVMVVALGQLLLALSPKVRGTATYEGDKPTQRRAIIAAMAETFRHVDARKRVPGPQRALLMMTGDTLVSQMISYKKNEARNHPR